MEVISRAQNIYSFKKNVIVLINDLIFKGFAKSRPAAQRPATAPRPSTAQRPGGPKAQRPATAPRIGGPAARQPGGPEARWPSPDFPQFFLSSGKSTRMHRSASC